MNTCHKCPYRKAHNFKNFCSGLLKYADKVFMGILIVLTLIIGCSWPLVMLYAAGLM